MSTDPHTITFDQVRDLVAGLGLGRDIENLRSVLIDPHGITVVRLRRNEAGRVYIVGDDVATETVTIKLVNR